LKVFISSVIVGFETYRDAVENAAKSLGSEIVRAENFPASPHTPQVSCLSELRKSDLMILLLGSRYGQIQPSGLSATHEEFIEAKNSKAIIAFVESGVSFEDKQAKFVEAVQDWQGGKFTKEFSDADELASLVTRAIHEYIVSASVGVVDAEQLIERSKVNLPETHSNYHQEIAFECSITSGPTQSIIRPAKIGENDFSETIIQKAAFGKNRVLSFSDGIESEVMGHSLVISQEGCSIAISEQGDLLVRSGLPKRKEHTAVIIKEDLQQTIFSVLSFCSELLDLIDPTNKISHIALAGRLVGADYAGWQTLRESQNSSGSYSVFGMGGKKEKLVTLNPAYFKRGKLKFEAMEISEDLVALLEGNHKGN